MKREVNIINLITLFKKKLKEKLKGSPIFRKIYNFKNRAKIINKGKKNNINTKSLMLKSEINILGNYNEISIGLNSTIKNVKILMTGNNHKIIIGENCHLSNLLIRVEDNYCELHIGNKTTFGQNNSNINSRIFLNEPYSVIKIGQDCMLSCGIDIRNGDAHSIIDKTSKKRINFAENIIISDHVWIGAYSNILKGVNIEKGSVVGIRSVVTKNVDAFTVVAGVPAIVIKDNIEWDRKRIYYD